MWHRGRRVGVLVGLLGLVGAPLAALVLAVTPAGATGGPGCPAGNDASNTEVTTNADSGLNSLPNAFGIASGRSGPQTICVDSGVGTITLTTGVLSYSAATTPSLTLEGNGVTISGNNASEVMDNGTSGPLTLDKVTITDGNAPGGGGGGGIGSVGTVTVTNSTISGNTAGGAGGGGISAGTVTLVYATVVQNNSSGGANVNADSLTSFGSVVAGDLNCVVGTPHSSGFNYSDDTSCDFTASGDNQATGNNPQLGALGPNGGPTNTMVPDPGSPLIDAIPSAHCGDGNTLAGFAITTDQRGLPRPDSASPNCDIGAVEVQPAAPAPTAPTALVLTPAFTG